MENDGQAPVSTQNKEGRRRRRVWIYGASGLLVLAMAAGGYWYLKRSEQSEVKRTDDITAHLSQLETDARQGRVGDMSKSYDALAAGAKDEAEKRKILISKADASFLGGLYRESIEAALQADAINRGVDSVEILAEAYYMSEDTENAIRYYRLAIEEAGSVGKPTDYYKSQIERLQQ